MANAASVHSPSPSTTSSLPEDSFPAQVWQLLGVFRSVQLAIVLLSLLGLGVLIGVLIPQDGLVETFELKTQYGQWYRPMAAAGLFTVYSSAWFIALQVLFFFNLLFGSFQWLRPATRAAVQVTYSGPEHALASPNRAILSTNQSKDDTVSKVALALKKRGYWVHTRHDDVSGQTRVYAHQWNISRLGPVVAHIGILLLLVASVIGAFTGFKGQQMLAPGQTGDFAALDNFTPSMSAPWWQGSKPDWKMVLHDFDIEYYAADPTTPKQYISDLELQSADGVTLARQDVSVNHPLDYDGVMFYQANFAPTGKFFLTVNGEPTVASINTTVEERPISLLPVGPPEAKQSLVIFPFFVQRDEGVTRNHVQVFLHDGTSVADWQANDKVPPHATLFEGDTQRLSNAKGSVTVGFDHPQIATGFQIKKAPETPWMYTAFAIIMLGTVLCFFSQRQVWVAIVPPGAGRHARSNDTVLYLSYKTNKAKWSFLKQRAELEAALAKDLHATLETGSAEFMESSAA